MHDHVVPHKPAVMSALRHEEQCMQLQLIWQLQAGESTCRRRKAQLQALEAQLE